MCRNILSKLLESRKFLILVSVISYLQGYIQFFHSLAYIIFIKAKCQVLRIFCSLVILKRYAIDIKRRIIFSREECMTVFYLFTYIISNNAKRYMTSIFCSLVS